MHPEVGVLAHTVVEAIWTPRVGEKDERYGLAEVVQLQVSHIRATSMADSEVLCQCQGMTLAGLGGMSVCVVASKGRQ